MTGLFNSRSLNFLKAIMPQSSESDVELKIVIPLLKILGYSDADWRSQARNKNFEVRLNGGFLIEL